MKFIPIALKGAYVIELTPNTDARGWFARTFSKEEFKSIGHNKEWVQINHSFTSGKGVVRGMHFQFPPFAEIKMVRCLAGAIYDVIIDLRSTSPTFLQWYGIELTAENRSMIYIPEGFAHGFQTISENCELLYFHTCAYTPSSEGGVKFDDPTVGINWPLTPVGISERDAVHPLLTQDYKGIIL